MVTERFKFISLLALTLLSLLVAVVLSVAITSPSESVRSVVETCSWTWKVGVCAVAWRVSQWRRRARPAALGLQSLVSSLVAPRTDRGSAR